MTKTQWSVFVSKARAGAGMTLHEFGEALGVSWVTIWRWENEYTMPREDAIDYWKGKIENV